MKLLLTFLIFFNLSIAAKNIYVLDKKTFLPVEGAIVNADGAVCLSDKEGKLNIDTDNKEFFIKAYGYKQNKIAADTNVVLLEPFRAKTLYVSFWAAGSSKFMKKILHLARTTEINSVIVDVKNEFGNISYKTDVKLAKEIGAHNSRTIYNIEKFIKKLKDENLYVIARIVVFKDDILARAKNEYALKLKGTKSKIWRNNEGLAWVDPFETKVHEYVTQIAADAASKGFDEINFDYVRFPIKNNLSYKKDSNQYTRIAAISSFLKTANKALSDYNVYISVDTYGYVCWNKYDTNIGHTIKTLAQYSDYIAPMLYPSGFARGFLGYKNPTKHTYDVINKSIKEAMKKADISSLRFRPWLQSFKDYGFDRRFFRSKEINDQVKGAKDALCSGWMLWNPSSRFSSKGLQDVKEPFPVLSGLKNNMQRCCRKDNKPAQKYIP